MPIKTICFLAGFVLCGLAALIVPLWGVVGNVLYYIVGTGWWTAPIRQWGIRYSYILTLATAIGVAINWRKLRFGKPFLLKQEIFTLFFLAIVWISTVFGATTIAASYLVSDHPSLKLSKIVIFSFLITHIVTRIRNLNVFFWALIIGTLHLGIKAYQVPARAYIEGRLENVGGTDFRGSNDLAVFLAVMIPIIGIMFLKTHWPGKILCAICGIFALNAIVLTRSRTGLIGLLGGACILALLAPKQHRNKIVVSLIIAGLGFVSLMDTRFINRSKTILSGTDIQDRSAQGRMEIWRGGIKMIQDNPFGVGAGNFYQNIGRYNPELEGRDAHNTYIRCAADLGIHGLALLIILIVNAALMLRNIKRQASDLPHEYLSEFQLIMSGLASSITVFIVSGLTETSLYFEAFWWWLLLPVCLQRCLNNLQADIARKGIQEKSSLKLSTISHKLKKQKT